MVKKLTEAQKKVLKDMVENKCQECKQKKPLHIHRIIRGWQGGEYVPQNIKVVCHDCHSLYHAEEFK